MRPNSDMRSLIEAASIPEPNSGCWLWERGVNRQGYGKIKALGKTVFAHRAAYVEYVSPIPDRLQVCHRCDTPYCVNPGHLFLGTAADNHADRNRKNRQVQGDRQGLRRHPDRAPRGERNSGAKLTESQVLEIRCRLAGGQKGIDLAAMFGVSITAIHFIRRRKTWGHI
jgi:hypothetical protein